MKPKSNKVPQKIQARFEAITTLTDAVCYEHLDEEYADMSRQLTAALARKRPSPLKTRTCKYLGLWDRLRNRIRQLPVR